MNVENLKKIRDAIADEDNPTEFTMAHFFTTHKNGHRTPSEVEAAYGTCGTAACIAGFAVGLFGAHGSYQHTVLHVLELDRWADADYLSMGLWSKDAPRDDDGFVLLEEITREETLAYLDRCIEAGEVVRT